MTKKRLVNRAVWGAGTLLALSPIIIAMGVSFYDTGAAIIVLGCTTGLFSLIILGLAYEDYED